jgi:hypothetical protein
MEHDVTEPESPGTGRVFAFLAGFLVVGVVIVGLLWGAVNLVAAGELGKLAIALPMLVVFVVFLVLFARQVSRLESRR